MNDMPTVGKTYTETELQDILRRSGLNKKMVAATIIGVYDNGEQIIQSAYHEHGLLININEVSALEDIELDAVDSGETSNES